MTKLKEDGGAVGTAGAASTNVMGTSSSTPGTGGIDTFDPLLRKKPLRNILKRKTLEDIKNGRK